MTLSERVLAKVKADYQWSYAMALGGRADLLDDLIKAAANETALTILSGDGDF